MARTTTSTASAGSAPGDTIRALRKQVGLTLGELGTRTGLSVSTLSKLEKGNMSLSYDKLMLISRGLGVDMAQLLDASPPHSAGQGGGRRVVIRKEDGRHVETSSYKQVYLATELLNKKFTPLIAEMRARTLDEFFAEFGDFIRHPGEEFVYVLEGEIAVHTELYSPVLLRAGDSMYFDSEMGHAYLKASDAVCRTLACCASRGHDDVFVQTFVDASEQHAAKKTLAERSTAKPQTPRRRQS